MSNIPMNNLNIQRRVLNSMHNQSMPMLSNHCFVPLPPNQNQERNSESKINLAFGLLRKNTARTNGIWKIIQSLINRMKKVEEMAARIDQVIKRNEELEDKRRKNNKKRNEKKRIKREKRQEEKERKRKKNEIKEKEIRNEEDKQEDELEDKKQANLDPKHNKEEQRKKEEKKEENKECKDSRIPKNDFLEISRIKFDSRKNINDSMNNLEISRTNLINKKFINKKKIINNKDEISFGGNQLRDNSYDDECSLQLNDKINQSNEKLSNNGRNKQNVIKLINRFIINNKNIYNSNHRWVCHTFIPLIEDIMDLNLYDIDVSDYVRKVKSPPDFRKKFWQWWQKKDEQKQMSEILRVTQKLKQSKDPDIMKLINSN